MTATTQRPRARALFSATGLAVLGAYLFVELWLHAAALGGPLAYRARLERLLDLPAVGALGISVVVALAFHVSYGIVLALRPELNVVRLGRGRGWTFVVERLSAIALVVFLALHFAFFWWPLVRGELTAADAYPRWVLRLSTTHGGVPVTALGYVFGLAACAFHFANGAFLVALRWGFLATRRSRRRGGPAFAVLGVAVFSAGFLPVIHFATGERPWFDRRPLEAERCLPEDA